MHASRVFSGEISNRMQNITIMIALAISCEFHVFHCIWLLLAFAVSVSRVKMSDTVAYQMPKCDGNRGWWWWGFRLLMIFGTKDIGFIQKFNDYFYFYSLLWAVRASLACAWLLSTHTVQNISIDAKMCCVVWPISLLKCRFLILWACSLQLASLFLSFRFSLKLAPANIDTYSKSFIIIIHTIIRSRTERGIELFGGSS